MMEKVNIIDPEDVDVMFVAKEIVALVSGGQAVVLDVGPFPVVLALASKSRGLRHMCAFHAHPMPILYPLEMALKRKSSLLSGIWLMRSSISPHLHLFYRKHILAFKPSVREYIAGRRDGTLGVMGHSAFFDLGLSDLRTAPLLPYLQAKLLGLGRVAACPITLWVSGGSSYRSEIEVWGIGHEVAAYYLLKEEQGSAHFNPAIVEVEGNGRFSYLNNPGNLTSNRLCKQLPWQR